MTDPNIGLPLMLLLFASALFVNGNLSWWLLIPLLLVAMLIASLWYLGIFVTLMLAAMLVIICLLMELAAPKE